MTTTVTRSSVRGCATLPPAIARLTSAVPERWQWRTRRLVDRLARELTPPAAYYYVVRRRGLWWVLCTSDEVDRDLFWHGSKEPGDWTVCRSLLSPGAHILDVGANFGYYALTFAHALRQRCSIHAFEPNPPTYQRLCAHVRMNNMECIVSHSVGLGRDEAVFGVCAVDDNTGAAYLVPASGSGSSPRTQVIALDKFAALHGLSRIDFVKVDIEGHECLFLDGAQETLSRLVPPMMIEIHPEALARNGHGPEDVVARLERLGYREFHYRRINRMTRYGSDAFADGSRFHNVFCFRECPRGWPS